MLHEFMVFLFACLVETAERIPGFKPFVQAPIAYLVALWARLEFDVVPKLKPINCVQLVATARLVFFALTRGQCFVSPAQLITPCCFGTDDCQ